jgi:hypothetical protein
VNPKCPRCSGKLRVRQLSVEHMSSQILQPGWRCEKCGPIDRKDFPPDVLRRMDARNVWGLLLGLTIFIIGAVAVLIIAFKQ